LKEYAQNWITKLDTGFFIYKVIMWR